MTTELNNKLINFFKDKPVLRAYLFGSFVRNESKAESDLDILVDLDYENGADYFVFFDMQQQLKKILSHKVDLVSSNGLSSYIKPIIDKEKVLIYEKQSF